jgi:hypothetical protein
LFRFLSIYLFTFYYFAPETPPLACFRQLI